MDTRLTVGKIDYPLALTVEAAELIDKRFGGIENLESVFTEDKKTMDNINDIVDLMVIVVNGGVEKAKIDTGEELPLLDASTAKKAFELYEIKEKFTTVIEAIKRGSERKIESEPTEKN